MNFFELKLHLKIFISKQNIFDKGKYLLKAAAEDPA